VSTGWGGGGGGGGAFNTATIGVVPGNQIAVAVGAGGAGGNYGYPGTDGANGGNSIFGTINAIGGGGGGGYRLNGANGASGGGGAGGDNIQPAGGIGSVGGNGGHGYENAGGGEEGAGGGGGAGAAGANSLSSVGGAGGAGLQSALTGNYYGGGGGGGGGIAVDSGAGGAGGSGGGGAGSAGSAGIAGYAGAANTGGGGGGSGQAALGGAGGSGVVIIDYPTVMDLTTTSTAGGTVSCTYSSNGMSTPCTMNYVYGTGINMTAAPGANYVFTGWTGSGPTGYTGSSNSISLAIEGVTTELAVFTGIPESLSLSSGANGTVSCAYASNGLAISSCSGTYPYNTVIAVNAVPNSGYAFAGWAGTGTGSYTGASNPANVTLDGAVTEAASFLTPYYAPVILTNSQGSATPSGFQQQLVVNSLAYSPRINAGWSNVEFTSGASAAGGGTPLYAWVESNATASSANTVVWVRLNNAIAASGGTQTIYMNFMPSNVMASNTAYTGEAPNISSAYGRYDNGALVFSDYGDFAGNALSPAFYTAAASGGTVTVNNGITLYSGTSSTSGYAELAYTTILTVPYNVIETRMDLYGSSGGNRNRVMDSFTMGWADRGFFSGDYYAGGYGAAVPLPSANTIYNLLDQWTFTSTTALTWTTYAGGALSHTASTTYSPTTGNVLYYPDYDSSGPSVYNIQWTRVRHYPPSGVMPSATFFGATQGFPPAYSFSASAGTGGTVACKYASNGIGTSCANSYPLGTVVTVNAVPNSGNVFSGWAGTGAGSYTGPSNPANAVVNGIVTETASFTAQNYVPITLTNSQGSATSSGFQQMLNIPTGTYSAYINPAWNNVEFTASAPIGAAGNVPLYAWIENNALGSSANTPVWVNLGSNTVPAGGGLTIYMNFLPSNVMTSNTAYTGEAPQMYGGSYAQASYGQYDNGNSVFGFYDNFIGSALNTNRWTVESGIAPTISNSLKLTANTGTWSWTEETKTAFNPQTNILDVDSYDTVLGTGGNAYDGQVCWMGTALATPDYELLNDYSTSKYGLGNYNGAAGTASDFSGTLSTSSYNLFSVWASSSATYATANYGSQVSASGTGFTSSTSLYPSLGIYETGSALYVQYIRVRAMPPSGVMPSAAFGGVA
jgi:hypothetical protein